LRQDKESLLSLDSDQLTRSDKRGGAFMNPPANDESHGIGLYVINLDSSSIPMALTVPFRHELVGFTVFRSRSFEHGRERFRLHLGYFESERRAEEALPVVRKHYPDAWISAAPTRNLGSLDNTLNTEFRLLRTAYARVVTRASATATPAPVPANVVAGSVLKGSSVDAGTPAPAPTVQPPQHYAVQLEWSLAPIVAADVPPLAILKAYHLYTVRMLREGFPQQGLRLGFFASADAARQVAASVRQEFPEVAVVPVSHREYSRANELARQRALKAVPGGNAPGASAVTGESEACTAPARAAVPTLPAASSGTPGLVSPADKPRTREEVPSPFDIPNLKTDHWRDW
jgi:hypothetical protein